MMNAADYIYTVTGQTGEAEASCTTCDRSLPLWALSVDETAMTAECADCVFNARMNEPVADDVTDAELHAQIDREAGMFRLRFITDVPGQQAVYLAKEAEAARYAAEEGAGSYPYLEAEAAVRGIPLADMAAMIGGIAAGWRALSVGIEARRIAAKEAVTAAATSEAKRAAAQIDWEGLLQ